MKKFKEGLRKSQKGTASENADDLEDYRAELEVRWEEFIHKARIHEMLKCLQSEHERLQVLRNNLDFGDLALDESNQLNDDDEKEDTGPRSRRTSQTEGGMQESMKKSTEILAKRKTAIAVEIFQNKNVITEEEFEGILELCDDRLEKQALKDAFEERKNREKYLHGASERRQMLYDFINSKFFIRFMLVVIIISTLAISLVTFEGISTRYSYPLTLLDSCIIAIFVLEAIFKIVIYRGDYFKQIWNLLDMLIIIVYLVEVILDLGTKTFALSASINSSIEFKILKSLRALRLLRVIKFLPNLQVVLITVFQSMLSMGSISVLMLLFIFVFAVMGRGLFFETAPKHFGTIWLAFVTLFQLLTLDDWFELLQNIREDQLLQYWFMFAYLFCYILLEYFVFLNLFVAVLVDNFQLTLADAELRKKKEEALFRNEQEQFLDIDKLDEEELKAFRANKASLNQEALEMEVDEYYPVDGNSKDAKLVSNFFKDMNALDFQRWLWKRRAMLLNSVIDQALDDQRQLWNIPVDDAKDDEEDERMENKELKQHKRKSQDSLRSYIESIPGGRKAKKTYHNLVKRASRPSATKDEKSGKT